MKTSLKDDVSMGIFLSNISWRNIKAIKEFICSYLHVNFFDDQFISRATVTSSEMLENAVKYSVNKKVSIRLLREYNDRQLRIIVHNYCLKEDAEYVISRIREMNLSSNSLDYYLTLMRTKNKSRRYGGGGLGLARINHEARAKISAEYVDQTSEIIVTCTLK